MSSKKTGTKPLVPLRAEKPLIHEKPENLKTMDDRRERTPYISKYDRRLSHSLVSCAEHHIILLHSSAIISFTMILLTSPASSSPSPSSPSSLASTSSSGHKKRHRKPEILNLCEKKSSKYEKKISCFLFKPHTFHFTLFLGENRQLKAKVNALTKKYGRVAFSLKKKSSKFEKKLPLFFPKTNTFHFTLFLGQNGRLQYKVAAFDRYINMLAQDKLESRCRILDLEKIVAARGEEIESLQRENAEDIGNIEALDKENEDLQAKSTSLKARMTNSCVILRTRSTPSKSWKRP